MKNENVLKIKYAVVHFSWIIYLQLVLTKFTEENIEKSNIYVDTFLSPIFK